MAQEQSEKVELKVESTQRSGEESHRCIEIRTCHLLTASLCKDPYHRKLATCSIICGLSCIGIMSLTSSLKAEEAAVRHDEERSLQFTKKARNYGIMSILVLVLILIMLPVLVVFVSYLLTLVD